MGRVHRRVQRPRRDLPRAGSAGARLFALRAVPTTNSGPVLVQDVRRMIVNDPPPEAAAAGQRLAAVDVGSNSVRLLVAEVAADGTYRILDDEKQTTRLAQGLAATGALGEPAIRQSLEALRHMQAIAAGYGARHVEVIATSAVRAASNGAAFLPPVRATLGLEIEVIAPEEEGRLSFASIARHFNLHGTRAVAVDLGGGSTEVILVTDRAVEAIYSLPLGAVRLTEA